jgi:uncharacterized protein YdeI (YjbR/CyaY-like superfamily)
MPRDPRIDAYIARQAEFARPILEHLRAVVHAAYPDVEEAVKWGMPAYLHQGKLVCTMAAFKAHATFGFWKGALVAATSGLEKKAMGQFGRLTSLADLPDDATIKAMVGRAVALAEQGVKVVRPKKHPQPDLVIPDDLQAALEARAGAATQFAALSPSAQREYLEWVTEAKRPETRAKRIAQAAEWISEGKKRNWKYER